jgi:peptidyl-prolyl cis-trans isomerase C
MIARVLREPLVHFAVLGVMLFVVGAWRETTPSEPPATGPGSASEVIRVDDVVRRRLVEGWTTQNGTPPGAEDTQKMIDHWVREEVLFREGMARGLDRDDERVRARVASKMGFVVDAQLVVPEPSDDELRAYFDAHADRWSKEARIDFTHVFASAGPDARSRIDALLPKLQSGVDPNGLGDTFTGGRRYRSRKLDDLATQFGATFVEALDAQPVNTWAVRTSRFGVHAVRVDARTTAGGADFAAARLDVRHALLEERRQEAFDAAVDVLVKRWRVER